MLLLTGCANLGPNPYGATTYSGSANRSVQQVSYGTVISLAAARVVPSQNEQVLSTGIGAVAAESPVTPSAVQVLENPADGTARVITLQH
jgi:outer membrane lipoprotein SlyB